MAYYVWRSSAAHLAMGAMSDADARRYSEVEEFLADFPRPLKGASISSPMTLHGDEGYMLRPRDFGYLVFYTVDDEAQELTIRLIMKADV